MIKVNNIKKIFGIVKLNIDEVCGTLKDIQARKENYINDEELEQLINDLNDIRAGVQALEDLKVGIDVWDGYLIRVDYKMSEYGVEKIKTIMLITRQKRFLEDEWIENYVAEIMRKRGINYKGVVLIRLYSDYKII